MQNNVMWKALIVTAGLAASATTQAQYEGGGAAAAATGGASGSSNAVDLSSSPLRDGSYAAVMGQFVQTLKDPVLDKGYGGTVLVGSRIRNYALEAGFGYTKDHRVEMQNFSANGLLFPFDSLPNLYGLAGFGATRYNLYPFARMVNSISNPKAFVTVDVKAGIGYMIPFSWGRYEYALRAETLFRLGDRFLQRETDFNPDISAPSTFNHILLNVGLQLPLRRKLVPPTPPPVEVVSTTAACADGIDNDGDGKIDFPADPGCASADDMDETDPPQCSDGKDNDGDGLIDYPLDKGCTSATDDDETDPPPPCMPPESNERISLKGCGTGDFIVLRGVNFDFNKASLTAESKTILDTVAAELLAYPNIHVELGGHTDGRGSESYNERLSNRRAGSVAAYLVSKGVAEARLTWKGYGESMPIADNGTDAGRELNRRVELKVTSGAAASMPAIKPAASPAAEGSSTEPQTDAAARSAKTEEALPSP